MEIKEIEQDIDKYAKLESVKLSQGGKLLIESLQTDILNCINELTGKYKEISHIELIAVIARLEARLNLLKTLERSEQNKQMAKDELQRILENNN